MKNFIKFVFMLILIASVLMVTTICVNAERPVKMIVGGELLETDVNPVIVNGRAMLPVRAIFEKIGATVSYNDETQTIVATKKDIVVTMTINSEIMSVNDKRVTLEAPAFIQNGRTLVPVRACAEAFNLDVKWYNESKTITIKTNVSVISREYSTDGAWKNYTYDENGNMILREESNGIRETYKYDNLGNVIYSENNGYWKKYTYNEYGEVVRYEYLEPAWGTVVSCKYEYDEKGNLIYDDSYMDIDGYIELSWHKYTYGDNGEILYQENSDGSSVKYNYDKWGNLVSKDIGINWFKYTYDNFNNVIYEEWSTGQWRKYAYNENGQETYKEWCDSPETGYTYWKKSNYDGQGRLTYEEWSTGGKQYYEYNNLGKLATIEVGGGIPIERYEYDGDGNLLLHNTTNKTEEYIVVYR